MTRYKAAAGISLLGFIVSLFTSKFLPELINLLIPTLFSIAAIALLSRFSAPKIKGPVIPQTEPMEQSRAFSDRLEEKEKVQVQPDVEGKGPEINDPFWGPVIEYIQVTEDMVISEGQKNNLDDEIVEKTLSVLARVNRLIPQLKTLQDGNINHNIQRLIFKDLNGAINPFLNLSGEAKRQNRRLLLNGLKDINTKLSMYVETIEHKDLIELQTRVDLIQQRYRSV
ncbi:hypothetical protein [Paenibacillus lautus]|uniref:hypothetical protein n=1 Tax=Paenibacillus lautus TaxID=1401 RepID=UPI003D29B889